MGKILNGLNLCGLHPNQDSANYLRTIFPRLLENPGRRFGCRAPPVLPTRRSGRNEFCTVTNCRLTTDFQYYPISLTLKASQQSAQGSALGKPNQIMPPLEAGLISTLKYGSRGFWKNSQWALSLRPPSLTGFRDWLL